MFDFASETALEAVKTHGLDKIRCSLTGKVLAQITDESLNAAIGYLTFEDPLISDEAIVDSMQLRWIVQCSRPAPHLTGFKNHSAMLYLVNNHPRDVYAMLLSQMLFEHSKIKLEADTTQTAIAKLNWLVQLQESEDFQTFNKDCRNAVDTLIRIDAIHGVRRTFYAQKIRELAAQVRESEIDMTLLNSFIVEVESHGFKALAVRQDNPPVGNTQSLHAALQQSGVLPYQLRLKENEAKQKQKSNEFATLVAMRRHETKMDQLRAGLPERHTAIVDEIAENTNKTLLNKMKSSLERDAAEKAAAKNPKSASKPKKASKAAERIAARYGNIDLLM